MKSIAFKLATLATAASLASGLFIPSIGLAATKVPAKKVVVKKTVVKKKPVTTPYHSLTTDKTKAGKTATWTGVITGVEDKQTFYFKQNIKNNLGDLRVKVTPQTVFVRVSSASSLSDFEGGDVVEITGIKLDASTIQATQVKYVSDKFKGV